MVVQYGQRLPWKGSGPCIIMTRSWYTTSRLTSVVVLSTATDERTLKTRPRSHRGPPAGAGDEAEHRLCVCVCVCKMGGTMMMRVVGDYWAIEE